MFSAAAISIPTNQTPAPSANFTHAYEFRYNNQWHAFALDSYQDWANTYPSNPLPEVITRVSEKCNITLSPTPYCITDDLTTLLSYCAPYYMPEYYKTLFGPCQNRQPNVNMTACILAALQGHLDDQSCRTPPLSFNTIELGGAAVVSSIITFAFTATGCCFFFNKSSLQCKPKVRAAKDEFPLPLDLSDDQNDSTILATGEVDDDEPNNSGLIELPEEDVEYVELPDSEDEEKANTRSAWHRA